MVIDMEAQSATYTDKLRCISCGAYVAIGAGSVKLPCPECGEVVGRCARCRTLGKKYNCKCGYEGP